MFQTLNGQLTDVPLEVSLMLRASEDQPDSEAPGAVVLLLDWFRLDQELILVQERPRASVDLLAYMRSKGGQLQEQDAKVCGGQPGWGFSSASLGLQGGDRGPIVVCSGVFTSVQKEVCVCVCVCVCVLSLCIR